MDGTVSGSRSPFPFSRDLKIPMMFFPKLPKVTSAIAYQYSVVAICSQEKFDFFQPTRSPVLKDFNSYAFGTALKKVIIIKKTFAVYLLNRLA